jgi:hypothetical protein
MPTSAQFQRKFSAKSASPSHSRGSLCLLCSRAAANRKTGARSHNFAVEWRQSSEVPMRLLMITVFVLAAVSPLPLSAQSPNQLGSSGRLIASADAARPTPRRADGRVNLGPFRVRPVCAAVQWRNERLVNPDNITADAAAQFSAGPKSVTPFQPWARARPTFAGPISSEPPPEQPSADRASRHPHGVEFVLPELQRILIMDQRAPYLSHHLSGWPASSQ